MAGRVGGLFNAEDVIQEAFYRALKYIDTFNPDNSDMSTWFSKIARRAQYDFMRQETMQGLVREEQPKEEPIVDLPALGISTTIEVEKRIGEYKENHQHILRLSYLKGYRPREIVEIVDDNLANVYKVLSRFKADMLEAYDAN